MPSETERIIFKSAVDAERKRQDATWGGPRHDDLHSRRDWVAFICREAGKAANNYATPGNFERQMVQVASLACAAWEAERRKS